MTSSAASETDSARNLTPGRSTRDGVDDRVSLTVGEVNVEQHDVGVERLDQRDGVGDVPASPTTSTLVAELGADAGEEERVIVDEYDSPCHRGSRSSTSVPAPGALVTSALPPARSSRPLIESRIP